MRHQCTMRRSEMRTLSIFLCNLFSVMPPNPLAYLCCSCGSFRIKLERAKPERRVHRTFIPATLSSRFTPIYRGFCFYLCSYDPLSSANPSLRPRLLSSLNDAAPASLTNACDIVILSHNSNLQFLLTELYKLNTFWTLQSHHPVL